MNVPMGITAFPGLGCKAVIVSFHEFRQPGVSRFDVTDITKSQLFNQPVLQRLISPFNPTFSLRGIRVNRRYAKRFHGAGELRQLTFPFRVINTEYTVPI